MAKALEPVAEDWSVGLAIVAHPDDLEYGTSAAIARWTDQGKRIAYCLATSGEAGIDAMDPEAAGPLREREQRAAAAAVGVDSVEFLGHVDGMIEYSLDLRRDLARVIRRHQPEVVIATNHRETWGGGIQNQADHVAVGRAVIDAVRDAGNRWVFRELSAEGLEPWNGVRMLIMGASPLAGHAVDVSDHLTAGIESLKRHEAYLAGLGGGAMSDPSTFIESFAASTGEQLGCRYAVSFEQINLG